MVIRAISIARLITKRQVSAYFLLPGDQNKSQYILGSQLIIKISGQDQFRTFP